MNTECQIGGESPRGRCPCEERGSRVGNEGECNGNCNGQKGRGFISLDIKVARMTQSRL